MNQPRTHHSKPDRNPIEFWSWLAFSFFGLWVLGFLALAAALTIRGLSKEREQPLNSYGSLLVRVDSLKLTMVEASARNHEILSTLNTRTTQSVQAQLSREDVRFQVRIFYAAILAALLSTAFLVTSQTYLARWLLGLAALTTVVLMYLIDIHILDVKTRVAPADARVAMTIQQLLALKPNDSSYYQINFAVLDSLLVDANQPQVRLDRKRTSSFSPNLEQIVFYVFPLGGTTVLWAVSVYSRYYRRKVLLSRAMHVIFPWQFIRRRHHMRR
jgi:hypothetical protein